ncbi:hypothetical protein GPECTOR_35g856 [Gonium pectorale]|uniref:Uncharacterized protein n=1 Tax=Gonium pectorale TaxID=33097 RepID=A0A150GC63_GONPE|nr:hypothetical protein GPECTOR_35g856 [Gonium pectorale]|eukprot:KXZ47418.1 hypothetical protein GPECTOR_35g856 [Gonium pectorale]
MLLHELASDEASIYIWTLVTLASVMLLVVRLAGYYAGALLVVLMGGGAGARAELQVSLFSGGEPLNRCSTESLCVRVLWNAGVTQRRAARLASLQADAAKAGWGDASKARHKLLRETLLTLLQRSEEISYGAGEEVGCGSEEEAERELLRWSLEEKARVGPGMIKE